jgi:predicted transcriptional regulator of viral defense system
LNYITFEKHLKAFSVFSIQDIEKRFPGFDYRRLVEWQKKKYILKIRNGFYTFNSNKGGEPFLYYVANKIWKPSYVSLESALSYYGFIPEGVFTITSITTLNTARYQTIIGNFSYRSIHPKLFFGYKLEVINGIKFAIAEPEKVILDFFYRKNVHFMEDITAMRFNLSLMAELINMEKLDSYLKAYESKVLNSRVAMLKKLVYAEY